MQTLDEPTPLTRRERRAAPVPEPKAKPRRRVSVFGVIGELLITAGVVVFLYVAWQMWIGDLIVGAQANAQSSSLSQEWEQQYEADPAPEAPDAEPSGAEPAYTEPPVLAQPADAETFGVMYIPRFGSDYSREIAGGTTRPRTLDTNRIGHYTDAPMPGEVGNFSLAAHRTTYGAPFNRLAELHVGDAIIVETPEGWFTYRFRTLEYVTPSEVEVLADVPQAPDLPATGERYITLTSCSPMYSLAERIVGYGVFEGFTPRAAGPPASMTEAVV